MRDSLTERPHRIIRRHIGDLRVVQAFQQALEASWQISEGLNSLTGQRNQASRQAIFRVKA